MNILALDPGTTKTGMVLYLPHENRVFRSGILPNAEVVAQGIQWCRNGPAPHIAIEMIASYGCAVGKTTFETCVAIGRFVEGFSTHYEKEIRRVYRKDVKLHLCQTMRAKDANVRQALIDRFHATGGGKVPQIGTKKAPGPLYGVSSHMWASLAVAVTASELWKTLERFPQ